MGSKEASRLAGRVAAQQAAPVEATARIAQPFMNPISQIPDLELPDVEFCLASDDTSLSTTSSEAEVFRCGLQGPRSPDMLLPAATIGRPLSADHRAVSENGTIVGLRPNPLLSLTSSKDQLSVPVDIGYLVSRPTYLYI